MDDDSKLRKTWNSRNKQTDRRIPLQKAGGKRLKDENKSLVLHKSQIMCFSRFSELQVCSDKTPTYTQKSRVVTK